VHLDDSVTVTGLADETVTGILVGDRLTVGGLKGEDDGFTDRNFTLTVVNENFLRGVESWTWVPEPPDRFVSGGPCTRNQSTATLTRSGS